MAQVITFEGYRPVPRHDDLPWTDVRIEEGDTENGPWTELEEQALDPVDSDPSHPQLRNFTTELADDAMGLWYRVTFLDANDDESQPTTPVRNEVPSTGLTTTPYIDSDTLKKTLTLLGTTFADWDIAAAIAATQSGIHDVCGRRFDLDITQETVRYYKPQTAQICLIDDLVEVTSIETDQDADGDHEREWTENTDYFLEPVNAPADGEPWTRIELAGRSNVVLPYWSRRSIKITGKFGWPSVPYQVPLAASLIATRLLKRMREAPFGVQMASSLDGASAAHIARTDPDVSMLLTKLVREKVS